MNMFEEKFLKEIEKELEKMGYDYYIYCDDLKCKVIDSVFVFPKLNKKLKIFDIECDVIDYLCNLGFRISYISFFGGKIGIWFENIKEDDEE